MADDIPSLRPPLFPQLRRIFIAAGLLAAGCAAAVAIVKISEARDQRAFDAAREAQARDAALARRLAARLVRLRRADPQGTTATTCPPTVSGRLAVVEKPILDWWVDDGSYETVPAMPIVLRSPVFGSIADHAAYLELGSARYVAVVQATATPVTSSGSLAFEGGTVDATLAVGDIEAGQFVCACHVTSQPIAILSLRQSSVEGDRAAQQDAERRAVVSAFWTESTKQLATIAPSATLITE